ncbi:hypothetical protein AAG906_020326 [Vitis piasezkii]
MSETLFDLSIPLSRVLETFRAMGFLAPLAPRALPDPVPSQFRLDLYFRYVLYTYLTQAVHVDTTLPRIPILLIWAIDS